jgi:2-phosphosulfolactate phosphatase
MTRAEPDLHTRCASAARWLLPCPPVSASPPWLAQPGYTVCCEQGEAGLAALAPSCDVVVIVDVLSFSTSVEIATSRGAVVLPYRFRDDSAAAFAEAHAALLAGRNALGLTLAPHTLVGIPRATRLVLPSPNGATLSLLAGGVTALAGCLRNRAAVARHAAAQVERAPAGCGRIAVIAAGERWPDGSLRSAFEDVCGAGAIMDALPERFSRSPEARAAESVFRESRRSLHALVSACDSGREKQGRGQERDVELACDLDASDCVPVLADGAYRADRAGRSDRAG